MPNVHLTLLALALFFVPSMMLMTGCGGTNGGSTTTPTTATCTPGAGDPIAIPSELLVRAVTAMIDPGVAMPLDSDGLIGRYFWNIVIARPANVPAALRYNPEYTSSILEGGEESVLALASDLATAPRDGATLRRAFNENSEWLYGTISRERYVETGLASYVADLLRVVDHMMSVPDYASVLASITARLEANPRDSGGVPYPSRLNAHEPAFYGRLWDGSIEATTPEGARRALWLHSFWYRRQLEGNLCDIAAILRENADHYR
jgi:hypothetical protein